MTVMEIDPDTNHALLVHEFNRMFRVRNALQAAGLCGAHDDPENDGREEAQTVIEALQRQGVMMWIEPEPLASQEPEQPHIVPPTLGERIMGGAISISSRAAKAASKRSPWSPMRARKTSRSKT